MARRIKKRRQKAYTGQDAKQPQQQQPQPTVHRYSAVDRGKIGQWWYDNKKIVKPVGLYGGGAILFIVLIIFGIISLF